jgi:hypothetical protein
MAEIGVFIGSGESVAQTRGKPKAPALLSIIPLLFLCFWHLIFCEVPSRLQVHDGVPTKPAPELESIGKSVI